MSRSKKSDQPCDRDAQASTAVCELSGKPAGASPNSDELAISTATGRELLKTAALYARVSTENRDDQKRTHDYGGSK